MRRHRLWSVPLAIALAASLSFCAAPPQRATRAPAPEARSPAPAPAPAPEVRVAPVIPAPAPPAPAAAPAPQVPTAAPVTLLLPLRAPDFQSAAEAVRAGVMAAQVATASKAPIDVRATDASAENVVAEYAAAIAAGTRVVVGPMTRTAVSAVAAAPPGTIATLALNQPETSVTLPDRFYTFGLAIDTESRMVARAAWEQGFRTAFVVGSTTPLARRSREAFVEEWAALGGKVTGNFEAGANADYTALRNAVARSQQDVAFLAAEADAARTLRPYLGSTVAVYATSQINDGRDDRVGDADMNGVRFVDMPWIVQPSSPAVVGYPRPQGMPPALERFYALGIDAYRIATELAAGRTNFAFDGVTGRITVGTGGVVERRPVVATYRQGARVAE
jgi:hypothetical protein